MNKRIIIICILILCLIGCFIGMKLDKEEENEIITVEQEITPIEEKIEIQEEEPIEEIIIEEEVEKETYSTMYSIVGLNIREQPNLNSTIVDVVSVNTELMVIDNYDNDEWAEIKIDNNYYFVARRFLSDEEVEVPKEEPKPIQTQTYSTLSGSSVLTKSKGVNYFNGHRETWYSQRVLPGGGLNIPGRHVDERGLVCDCDGYICVASNDYAKGTIVETSLGTGKVYDSGCPKNTIDIYTN